MKQVVYFSPTPMEKESVQEDEVNYKVRQFKLSCHPQNIILQAVLLKKEIEETLHIFTIANFELVLFTFQYFQFFVARLREIYDNDVFYH